jgi:hypothetical protein
MSKKTQIHEILVKYENQVWDSFPSIYTKDDVKKMLNQIIIEVGDVMDDETTTNNIDLDKLKNIVIGDVVDSIETYDFEDEIELELSYSNQIDITFNSDKIIRRVKESIYDSFEHFVEVEEEEEVES